jgi:hypothetical protein
VLLCALAIFALCAVASAQTPRNENDPRNQAPAVGTGGPPGGPTGLFTVFDGDTLRRGEYTFSIAYSNFDRDPGDVDLVETPLSFNIGLNDHVELFFQTNGYRGVKVNNPRNLSSFYLPNSQLFFANGVLGSGPAIILAPERVSGTFGINGQVFRPAFCPACIALFPGLGTLGARTSFFIGGQPFVQFPFTGGVGPNFGLTGNAIAPPFVSRLGAPSGGTSNFGAAAIFPGVGSPVGSILPGIVLTVRQIPANLTFNNIIVPDLFTVAPSYLPDAPFINRLYGESSWGTFQVGGKIRFTEPDNPLGIGIIPFYRWYLDKGADFGGFNQLQRGASPGGDIGDFGLIGFAGGRLSKHWSLSANIGYILNSNPKNADGFVLLDRPDEFLSGVGIDVAVNEHFQIIGELRSTQYVGGRTPNAFENHPLEALGGVKIFPRRWFGIGGAYRRHLNPQDQDRFDPPPPVGFIPSDDPHGFMVQVWAGHRNAREPDVLPNQAPVISSFAASTSTVTLPCPPETKSESGQCPTTATNSVGLTVAATDPDGDTLLYTYSTTGGRITGEGATVTWDLSGLAPGTYTASVEVDDGCGCISFSSTTVTIANCPDCKPILVCPTVTVSCADAVEEGAPATFTANFTQGTPAVSETYNWTVSAGTITSGQGTSSITVDTKGLGGNSVTATVEVGGVDPSCNRTASCTTPVRPGARPPRKFDEYGNIRFNDEKARLDNFAIELQNDPTSRAAIVGYGTCEGEGLTRANRAKDYLVNTRGIDAGRIDAIDGGCLPELKVQLWIIPQGATFAGGDAAGVVSPCPECKKKPTRRRGRRGEE